MTSRSESTRRAVAAGAHADADPAATNIATVAQLERDSERRKSGFDRVIAGVRAWFGSPLFLVVHAAVIAGWIALNLRDNPFDPYPFGLLNMILALEAICLSSFLLMAQDQMTRDVDRRDHLNLQVDLLAEQELTAILKLVSALAERAGIDIKAEVPEIDRLRAPTDVHKIAATLERELATPDSKDSTVERTPK